jgi:hypothetical protein
MEEMSITQLLDGLERHKKYLTEDHVDRIALIIKETIYAPSSGDGVLNDLLKEVQEQMTYLKQFRKQITAKGETATTREVKDMIQASTSLFSMLTKLNDDITNQDRLRKIETATVEVVRTLSGEAQLNFFTLLEEALK